MKRKPAKPKPTKVPKSPEFAAVVSVKDSDVSIKVIVPTDSVTVKQQNAITSPDPAKRRAAVLKLLCAALAAIPE